MFNNDELYNGASEGFSYLVNCYDAYAREVISARAFVDLRDGLKKVQRRIVFATNNVKKEHLQKCAKVISVSMDIHPHGDSSVWGAFALMTDENGSFNMPLFEGLGNLGHVWSSEPPAAYRYPKWKMHKNAEDYFKDKEIIQVIPSEEGEGYEAVVLPINYPIVLVNGTDGIAVSVASNIPSFNFGDVIDLTIKYLKTNEFTLDDVIVPDFPTGGILVKNDAELTKIMTTGKGKLKIRSKVEIDGKDILVVEVPFGKTVESIIKQIKKIDMKEIADVDEISGNDASAHIRITCKTKKVVDYVLMELYRRNILQNTFASNMTLTEGTEPVITGVHGVIERWCRWRKNEILIPKFKMQLEGIADELITLDYFIRLISNPEWKKQYVHIATNVSKKEAIVYLKQIFEDIPENVATWIGKREITAFNGGDTYARRYEKLCDTRDYLEESLANPTAYMIQEMEELKVSKAGQYDRKTVATYQDYQFSKIVNSDVVEDTSYCVWTLMKSGFLRKSRELVSNQEDVLCQMEGLANSILIGFDNYGRVLKVVGNDLPFTPYNDNGVYLPKYFDAAFQEDYKVLYLGVLDGARRMLVYRDGYVGFLDTSEWIGKKNVKIIQNGVNLAVYNELLEVYDENEIPNYLMVADDTNGKVKIGIVATEDIPVRSRTSRAKVFTCTVPDIKYLKSFDNIMELYQFIDKPEQYMGKLKLLKGDLLGNPEELLDGRYLEICSETTNEEE